MTAEPCYVVAPWSVAEATVDLDRLDQSASVFALSNGYLGIRGVLDDRDSASRGTHCSGFFDVLPRAHAETAYGYGETNQVLASLPDPTHFVLQVDGDDLALDRGQIHRHERQLDLRRGVLTRHLDWTSPAGRRVELTTRRLVSLARKNVAAIEYCVRSSERPIEVTLISGTRMPPDLDASAGPADAAGAARAAGAADAAAAGADGHNQDPRTAAQVPTLRRIATHACSHTAVSTFRTTTRDAYVSVGVHHHVADRSQVARVDTAPFGDETRTTVTAWLQPGQELRLTKFVAYAHQTGEPEPTRDVVVHALEDVKSFDELVGEQAEVLREYWANTDIEVDGDPELQQAIRFGMFQLLQATAYSDGNGVPAKGLTSNGYDGHTFWDSDGFVLPTLTYVAPQAARQMLQWRIRGLPKARRNAAVLALAGAAFPWRTIDGEECAGYWPAGTAAFHVNAVISDAFTKYATATGDFSLEAEGGLEVLIDTARLWVDLGHFDAAGRFHIDGVTGPDEYSALQRDNTFTNLMAARNLRAAADVVSRHERAARNLGVSRREVQAWLATADAMHVPYNAALSVHEQSSGFTELEEWDFARHTDYPLLLHHHYVNLYRSQVIKQADLVLALHWCREAFTEQERSRSFEYYEARTVRDSSLSAPTQAVVAASLGHLQLAYDYLSEAAQIDLRNHHGNTGHGLHIGSMAAAWSAVVEGFGGLRQDSGRLCFAPALPPALRALRFHLRWQDMLLRVEIDADRVTYTRRDDHPAVLKLQDDHGVFSLPPLSSVERSTPKRRSSSRPPQQPLHRAPLRRLPRPTPGHHHFHQHVRQIPPPETRQPAPDTVQAG